MQDLVTIGRFAQLTHLSIKALRLYDALGLLRPALVDFKSGFRYYSQDQIAIAKRIRLLRSLEMPLADIRTLLRAPDPDTRRAHLAAHQRWLEGRIVGYGRALTLLRTLVDECEQTGKDNLMEREDKPYRCSFCGKDNAEVRRMIAGPKGVFICDECVAKCNEIIAKEEAETSA